MNAGILERSYEQFINNIKDSSIEKYFGITTINNSKLKISISKMKNLQSINFPIKITLNIRYFKNEKIYNFNNLPIEIIRKIQDYGDNFIDMEVDIYFPKEYPYIRPVWCLSNIKHNIKLEQPLSIKEYYNYIITNHNKKNKIYWSPATKIEADIIEFIQRINHFEHLFYDS
jgi:hypothetical protein